MKALVPVGADTADDGTHVEGVWRCDSVIVTLIADVNTDGWRAAGTATETAKSFNERAQTSQTRMDG